MTELLGGKCRKETIGRKDEVTELLRGKERLELKKNNRNDGSIEWFLTGSNDSEMNSSNTVPLKRFLNFFT
jgi:hypothetical protein